MVSPIFALTCFIAVAAGQRGKGWRTRWPTTTSVAVPTTLVPVPYPTPIIVGGNPNIQSLYGQCGGNNWSGPVACPTGAYCKNDGNPWYSQCVNPDSDDDNDNGGASTVVITRTLTTVFTIVGPTPTRVSTYITYLTPKPTRTSTVTLTPDQPWNGN